MNLHMKKRALICFCLLLIVASVGYAFCYQINVKVYSYKKIEQSDGFYPDAYRVFHTEKEFRESAVCLYHGKKILQAIDMNFEKYSYVIVYGAKVERMYYSFKTTIFDNVSPSWAKPFRHGKFCLFLKYQHPDNNIYIYQIEKNSYLSEPGKNG